MTEVGRMLWQGCHVLRHEGVAYDEYVDQLSLLLFIKMNSEVSKKPTGVPTWKDLIAVESDHLLAAYESLLARFAAEKGIVGEIFHGARSRFRSPDGLQAVLKILDSTHWSDLDRDVQGEAFEYLLERTATEGKQGAGQYFTPRPLVKAVVACLRPGAKPTDKVIADPASGTGGFLVEAVRFSGFRSGTTDEQFDVVGNEIVPRVRRMALMNLILHGVPHPSVELRDALSDEESTQAYDVVLANPPFGSRSGLRPSRSDFWVHTGNKQINFVQHISLSLRPGGRAAIILPDNCFSGDRSSVQLWERIFARNRVHTILRLPKGTFAPYAASVMTNVVFLNSEESGTDETWIYDARANLRQPTGRSPINESDLAEFVDCFGHDPDGGALRTERTSSNGRWVRHTSKELHERSFKLERSIAGPEIAYSGDLEASLVAVEDGLKGALRAVRELRKIGHG
ncbi:HsdM family class I SAM-dependent methyltransferase [Curtobacterium sp. UNCCL17]|uniref:HsdM family class I SAM-dependent methyltransferase n=1 Tax=Curtobacterium sp. UNCCL17 TaxID=1449051 RepID=UPI0018CC3CDB|nr:N-6 DNA methylase [Curtobacterium sp. UNCCL17]